MSDQDAKPNNSDSPQATKGPRSVTDYTDQVELRNALSRVFKPVPLVEVDSTCCSSSTPSTSGHSNDSTQRSTPTNWLQCPFTLEPDSDLDIDWRVDNVDVEKSCEQTVEREMNRLLVLKSYLELDYEALTARDCAFDRLASLCKRSFNAPACFVFLLDIGRSWALSQEGKQFNLVPRKDTFCSHVIVSQLDCFVVNDASKDPRFMNSAYVKAENGVRFYAAAPLKAPEGFNIGTFCIIDIKPRDGLSQDDQDALKDYAKLAMDALVHQRDLHRRRKELEAAARKLASASHDLLTPLSVVQLSLSLLNEDGSFLARLDETQRECLRAVSSCCETMGGVCEALKLKHSAVDKLPEQARNDMITKVVKASSGGRPLTESDSASSSSTGALCTKTSKFADRLNELASTVAAKKTIPLSISVDEAVPKAWVGNEVQILHICLHLLVNSVERTNVGHVNFHVRVNESGACGQEELVFECTDTGSSLKSEVNPEDLKTIFEDYVLSSFSSDAQEGREQNDNDGRASPLGILAHGAVGNCSMYECFPIACCDEPSVDSFSVQIRSLGGAFGVTASEKEVQGQVETTFWFTIPLLLPEEVKPESNKRSFEEMLDCKPFAVPFVDKGPLRTALVVDDSVVMRKMLSRALDQLGYSTLQAADGMEGLKFMQESQFDLVLLDFLMPVMDGMDCVRAYRKWEKKNRPGYRQVICGMSAHANPRDIDRALLLGMTDYRPKPLSLVDLRQLKESTSQLQPIQRYSDMNTDDEDDDDKSMEAALAAFGGAHDSVLHARKKRLSFSSLTQKLSLQPGEKVCLVATGDESSADDLQSLIEEHGWKSFVTDSGEEALRLLKARNWGAVILDTDVRDMNGLSCVSSFREWEKRNRVHRQNNLLLMGHGVNPGRLSGQQMSMVQLPAGVDAAIEKPTKREDMAKVLEALDRSNIFEERDIVTRTSG